jgi:hypothetical protein
MDDDLTSDERLCRVLVGGGFMVKLIKSDSILNREVVKNSRCQQKII